MQQDNSPIQLVVFDLGRVLIRICDHWSEACQRAGVDWPDAAHRAITSPELAVLAHRHDTGELDLNAFSHAASTILQMSPADIQAASKMYLHTAFAGGSELIDELNSRGIATACLSNTNESHWRFMSDPAEVSHVPLHRLTHRFASHLIGARKPDPAIYVHVEQETGINPAAILFFDDVIENVEAAKRRGWNAWHVDPTLQNPIPVIRGALTRFRVL